MNAAAIERQAMIRALKAATGLVYSAAVSKGKFQLEIVNFNRGIKKSVEVTKIGAALPEAEFMTFLRGFKAEA
jgi:hypothetical protein